MARPFNPFVPAQTRARAAASLAASFVPPSTPAQKAQSLVEFGFVVPLLFGVSIVLFQFGILFMVQLNLVHATRDVGRWLAVHPDTTDAALETYVRDHLPSNLMPSAISFAGATEQDSPWWPRCGSLTSGRCAARPSGSMQWIQLRYDAAPHIFLPTVFSVGWWSFSVPTIVPAYTYHVMIEPR